MTSQVTSTEELTDNLMVVLRCVAKLGRLFRTSLGSRPDLIFPPRSFDDLSLTIARVGLVSVTVTNRKTCRQTFAPVPNAIRILHKKRLATKS